MKKIWMLLCLCLAGCIYSSNTAPYDKAYNNLVADYIKRASQEGFLVSGIGGGQDHDKIIRTNLVFRMEKYVDILQARELIVQKEEEFLALLNSNLELRPYLNNFPSKTEDFPLMISFIELNGDFVNPPHIANAYVCKNAISYSIDNGKFFEEVYREPYDTAYKIVYGVERSELEVPVEKVSED